jgi:Cu(I)/Ag(I) efflux system protein CusF
MKLFLIGSLLIVLAGCADQAASVVAPSPGSAPPAVDLGGSSRIPRIAASAGEGEGYGTMPAVAMDQVDHSKMDHGSMPGMNHAPAPQVAQVPQVQGSGTVNAVDAAGHKVTLNHNPIPAIGWPAMTMDFAVAHAVDLGALKPGMRVTFTMQRGGDGMYVIQSLTPAGGK